MCSIKVANEEDELRNFSGLLRAVKDFMDLQTRQASTMRDLIAAGEARRLGRTNDISIQKWGVAQDGLISAEMRGTTGVYQTHIRLDPRGHRCTCEDWQKNGRRVGPCKHVLRLGQAWLNDRILPAMQKMNEALVAVLEGTES
jgi:hypothetical protein